MFNRLTYCFVLLLSSISMSLAVYSPAQAADCGGNTPCSCGDNLVADRKLNPKVDPILNQSCTGDGLIMTVSGVALDLNGGIGGSGVGFGVLIAGGVTNVEIKNGGVDFFETGIGTAVSTTGTKVNSVRPNNNVGDGIHLVGNDNDLIDILAKRNGGNGVTVIGNSNLLRNHNDEYNGFHGMFVQGDGNEFKGNEASENANEGPGSGLRVEGNNNIFDGNKITKLNDAGIDVVGNGNIFDSNKVIKQKGDGFLVQGDGNILEDNNAVANRGVGYRVNGNGDPTQSTGNRARKNRQDPECSIYGVTTAPTCAVD